MGIEKISYYGKLKLKKWLLFFRLSDILEMRKADVIPLVWLTPKIRK
jgi:hypothetical protein